MSAKEGGMQMKRFKKIYGALLVVGGAVMIFTAGISPCCLAAVTEKELKNWPEQSYQGEELKKVREWEKTFAIKKKTLIRDTYRSKDPTVELMRKQLGFDFIKRTWFHSCP